MNQEANRQTLRAALTTGKIDMERATECLMAYGQDDIRTRAALVEVEQSGDAILYQSRLLSEAYKLAMRPQR